jgi:hypothetical protein
MELKAKAFPKNGNIHFIEENQHVPSNERLSQILIEWLVKTVYQIY